MVDNEVFVNSAKDIFGNLGIDDYSILSKKSQKETLQWFRRFLTEYLSYIVIYRPHPAEIDSVAVRELAQDYPNRFIVMPDLSVKQWIEVSDVCSTWVSTSVAEAYAAKKNCIIIRPFPISKMDDIEVYEDALMVTTYKQMEDAVIHYNPLNVFISQQIFNRYYAVKTYPAYKDICDLVDKIAYEKNDNMDNLFCLHRWKYLLGGNYLIKYKFKEIYKCLFKKFKFSIDNKTIRKRYSLADWEKNASLDKARSLDEELKIHKLNKIVNNY